jgi:hypothetical protein
VAVSAILTRCLGVVEFWGGATVAPVPYDRTKGAVLADQHS